MTEQASGAVAASSVEVPVQADDFVGQPCPICGKGTSYQGVKRLMVVPNGNPDAHSASRLNKGNHIK